MGWQEIAVALVIAGAVLFLLNRVVGLRRRRKRPAQSFVPLSQLKKRARGTDEKPGCH
jgi:hypothetical protein